MTKRYSDSYIGTFDIYSVNDMERLNELKAMVRCLNKDLKVRSPGLQYRVVMRGRKPLVKGYDRETGKSYNYDWCGNLVGGIANATAIDAYLYKRDV